MQLQTTFGVASMHMYGPSDAARAALNRSLAIAQARDNVLGQVGILGTLSMFCTRDGEFKTALNHARKARMVAATSDDPDATALAQSTLGRALHFIGDHGGARSELEAAFHHFSNAQWTYLGLDDRVLVGLGLARSLWVQGSPAQAVDRARETIKDAEGSTNPATLAVALAWVPDVFLWTGDLSEAEGYADRLVAHARSHSLTPYLCVGYGYKGALAIRRGNARYGVETLKDCLKQCHAVHYEVRNTELKIVLARGLLEMGEVDEATTLVDDTVRQVDENGDLFFMPEALRVRGRALVLMDRLDDAATWLARSLENSHRQGAQGWELRAAIDLASLWVGQGRCNEACRLLQPVFERFVEGLETADLKAAARLLTDLK